MVSSDGSKAREAIGVSEGVPLREVVGHLPRWRLEKRDNAIELFVEDRKRPALDLMNGQRVADSLLEREGFMRNLAIVREAAPAQHTDMLIEQALRRLYHEAVEPDDVVEWEGNLLVTVGITTLLNLLTGGAGTTFSNANAHLGVGDSNTAAAVGQVNLQASTNKLLKAMNVTYPVIAAPDIQFQSTFGSAEANFVWNEVATFNGNNPPTSIMLNRVVQALGTKSSGATWTLTETITWS